MGFRRYVVEGMPNEKYAPYLLTVFFFVFTNNILGLIPISPEVQT